MISKYKSKYKINKIFYSRLAIYITLTILLLYLLITGIISFAYAAGLDLERLPEDVCVQTSENFNGFFCFFSSSKDTSFYYMTIYGPLVWIIFSFLALVILNVFYISNRFYFSRLVREFSYGAVIYRIIDGKVEYLLLKMKHGHTSLCKGHQEGNESGEETAIREIKEETNLEVDLSTDFKTVITYSPFDQTIKDVTFYIACIKNNEQKPSDTHDDEVNSFEWCTYEDALFKITYDSDRDVVKKAHKYIKKHKFLK